MRWNWLRSAPVWGMVLMSVIPNTLLAQAEEQEEQYQVGQAVPPMDEGSVLVPMSLEEAVTRALEMNLDLQAARLDPRIQRYSMVVAQAAFDPTISSTLGYNDSRSQSTSQLDGGAQTTTTRETYNASLSKTMPWYGGRLSASFNNSKSETNNVFATVNPNYRSSFQLGYTQPLLAGLKTDNQRTALQTQEIQGEITDLQLLTRVANISDQVRRAYWALRAAIEQIEIQRQNLAQANELLEQNRIRVQLGSLSELQVVQAEAQVVSAEQALLNAEIQWRNQELVFKSLLAGGADDPLFRQTINPTDLPVIEPRNVDLDQAIEFALEERTDLRQQRQQRQISDLNLAVTRNNTLPDLSLNASYSVQGVGGNRYERSGIGGDAELVEEGGYLDGLQSIWDRDTPTWNLSLNFSYPVGNNAAKASVERARLQIQQADLDLRAQELSVVTQVTDAGLAVRDTYLQLQAAQRSREVAERSADFEITRFNVGAATNYEVMQARDALTSARLSELRAIINYVNAIAEFERVQRVGG
mgnify:CR=1 FL=1